MEKKYVSFRIEKNISTEKVRNQMYHDFRTHTPKNVDKELIHLNETLYESESFLAIQKEVKGVGKYAKALQIKQDEYVKAKTGRKLQKNTERFFSGIATFSSSMSEDYKSSPERFKECSLMFISRLQEKGLKPLYAQLHLDETTPHFHFTFDNIGDDGKSIRRNIRKQQLRDIQTIMGECFESMGYERGISAEITKRKHLSPQAFNDAIDRLKEDTEALDKLRNSPEYAQIKKFIAGDVKFKDLKENAKVRISNMLPKMP